MVPGVAIPGRPFIGLIGVAPSPHRLRRILERERRVVDAGGIAMLPEGLNAVPSSARVAAEGLRTIAPRETGGNMDIRHLGAGSRLILPVDVPGALLSFGDIHFAQGDGESCGTAIEVAGKVSLSCEVRKRSDLGWAPTYPSYQFVEAPAPAPRAFMATTGIPLSPDGENRYFDVYLAAQEALHEMIEHLVGDRGYSRAQAYVLVSVAADLSISSIVNEPNPVVSAILPLDIFLD
jgi:formamidase